MGSLGPMELLLILGILVIIFGAGRLADLGAGLGKGIREFRKASSEISEQPPQNTTTTPIAGSVAASQAGEGKSCAACSASNPSTSLYCAKCGTQLLSD